MYVSDCGDIFSVLTNTPGELLDVIVIFSVTALIVIISVLVVVPTILVSVKVVVIGIPVRSM